MFCGRLSVDEMDAFLEQAPKRRCTQQRMPHRREEKWEPEQPLRPNSVRADGDENGIEQSCNENTIYATWLTTRKIATRWPVGGPRDRPQETQTILPAYTHASKLPESPTT
jgi:hypothetical protein